MMRGRIRHDRSRCAVHGLPLGRPAPYRIDDIAYAMSYGAGCALIPDKLKDRRFAMSFIVRRLNPDQVRTWFAAALTAGGGPTRPSLLPTHVSRRFGITENVEIIRRIGGWAKNLKTTFGARDDGQVNVEDSTGLLRTRYAVGPDKLISDFREVDRVCREEEPTRHSGFIENVQPVTDPDTLADLNAEFEELVNWDADLAAEYLVPVVPGRS